MKSKRIKWLDFAKGFAIFLVVLSHSIGTSITNNDSLLVTILNTIGLFMMPVFFAVSGYLYKPIHNLHGFVLLVYKKFTSIILPGVFVTILGIFLTGKYVINKSLTHLWAFLILQYGDIWFLDTLFICFVIVGILNLCHIKLYIQIVLAFVLSSLSGIQFNFQRSIMNLGNYIDKGFLWDPMHNIEMYLLIFMLGIVIKKYNIVGAFSQNKGLIVSCYMLWILLILIKKVLIKNNSIFNDVLSLSSIIIFFIFCKKFKQYNYIFKFITKYGKLTLIIYLVHWIVIYFLMPYLISITSIYNMYIIIISKFIMGVLISLLLCIISRKFDIINFIFYPRKYINKLIIKTKFGKWLLN